MCCADGLQDGLTDAANATLDSAVSTSGDEQEMTELFEAEEASGVNKRELYKQNKEAKLMDRLERRMEGALSFL